MTTIGIFGGLVIIGTIIILLVHWHRTKEHPKQRWQLLILPGAVIVRIIVSPPQVDSTWAFISTASWVGTILDGLAYGLIVFTIVSGIGLVMNKIGKRSSAEQTEDSETLNEPLKRFLKEEPQGSVEMKCGDCGFVYTVRANDTAEFNCSKCGGRVCK